jgi:two-component system sensor histidine kinase ChvG
MESGTDSRKAERDTAFEDSIEANVGSGLRMKKLAAALSSGPKAKRRAVAFRSVWRGFVSRFSSRLTRRIILLNLGGLVALLLGFLYLNQFREGLIDARVQSLQTQSEIIAAAIAASATVDADAITIDPEKLLKLAPGQSYGVNDETSPGLEFSINPDRVGPLLRRLVSPTRTRARIYDRDGYMLMDSRSLAARSNILRFDLPAQGQTDKPQWLRDVQDFLSGGFNFARLPLYRDIGAANGKGYPELAHALEGTSQTVVRRNMQGETVISVATPIQRFRTIRGALLLSTQGGDIDGIIASERRAIFRIFLVSAAVMILLSAALAGAIAEPIRRLATAAEGVRRGVASRAQIPDFTARNDEIGHLSGALRDMTTALLNRMEAIERFAADVAHELKNPLASMASAVESMGRTTDPEITAQLRSILAEDVRRLDRAITDISELSRLDGELSRTSFETVEVATMVSSIVEGRARRRAEDAPQIVFDAPRGKFRVSGDESRLVRAIDNIIDNAISFSPEGGVVRISLLRTPDDIEIAIDDDGPGVPEDQHEAIFRRFHSDRPASDFARHSGLGLAIANTIVTAHNGAIKVADSPVASGARFVIALPAL